MDLASNIQNDTDDIASALRDLDGDNPLYAWKVNAHYRFQKGLIDPWLFGVCLEQIKLLKLSQRSVIYDITKRLFDICLSTVLILLLLPLLVLVGCIIKMDSPGPVFFKQVRVGQFFRPFWIYKFRTMHEGSESVGSENIDYGMGRIPALFDGKHRDPRVTKFGALLRRTSIDELPQILNVLVGNMSFIGPRPLSVDDSLYSGMISYTRFAVKPGMTGLWQSRIPIVRNLEEKIRLDAEYVKSRGIWCDIKIFFKTFRVLLVNLKDGF